jgi:hypothetical protein
VEEEVNFTALAWARAKVESLDVTGSLFGKSHTFEHNARTVNVHIPKIPLNEQLEPSEKHQRHAFLFARRTVQPTLATSRYHLATLEITIGLPNPLTAPAAIFQTPPKRPDIVGEIRTEQFDKLASEYHERDDGERGIVPLRRLGPRQIPTSGRSMTGLPLKLQSGPGPLPSQGNRHIKNPLYLPFRAAAANGGAFALRRAHHHYLGESQRGDAG